MTTRIITGAGLLIALLAALYLGGWVFAVLWIAAVLLAIKEEFDALNKAGHRTVSWPTWASLLVSIPCFLLLLEYQAIAILAACVFITFLLVSAIVLFRKDPELIDILISVMPLLSIALPGMCLLALSRLSSEMQRILLSLCFFVPVFGDTFAYFVGVRMGRVKLCPVVSPKKTVEGALGGLLGSVLTALAIYLIALSFGLQSFSIWHYLAIGLFGGLIGQIGDLFASIIKRHCQVKDFGHIFPGHGGMLDRLDSILFVAVFVYVYYLAFL